MMMMMIKAIVIIAQIGGVWQGVMVMMVWILVANDGGRRGHGSPASQTVQMGRAPGGEPQSTGG